jgi:predicted nucleic acid-binding Zn ribbon protein
MQKISDAPLTVCESCGGKLEKQVSRTGFQFKGEGWYVTDYAGKKNGGGEKSSDGAEKSSGGESTAKSESASNEKTGSSAKDTSSKKD